MSKKSILKLKNMLESEKIPYNFRTSKGIVNDLIYYHLDILPDLEPRSLCTCPLMRLVADSGYDPYCSDEEYCEIWMRNIDYDLSFFRKIKIYGQGYYWHDYISIYDAFEVAKKVSKELAEQ